MSGTATYEDCPRCGREVIAGASDPSVPCPGETPAQTMFWTAWNAGCYAEVETVEGRMIVNHRHNIEDPRAGYVVLTRDGRTAITRRWCECGYPGEDVYYERYSTRGREAHGYVCQGCRCLTQTG